MAPLTWRNVDAPDLSAAGRMIEGAGQNWGRAFAGLGDNLSGLRETQKNNLSADALAMLGGVGSEADLAGVMSQIQGQMRPQDMSPELLASIQGAGRNALGMDAERKRMSLMDAQIAATGRSNRGGGGGGATAAQTQQARQRSALQQAVGEVLPGEGQVATPDGVPQGAQPAAGPLGPRAEAAPAPTRNPIDVRNVGSGPEAMLQAAVQDTPPQAAPVPEPMAGPTMASARAANAQQTLSALDQVPAEVDQAPAGPSFDRIDSQPTPLASDYLARFSDLEPRDADRLASNATTFQTERLERATAQNVLDNTIDASSFDITSVDELIAAGARGGMSPEQLQYVSNNPDVFESVLNGDKAKRDRDVRQSLSEQMISEIVDSSFDPDEWERDALEDDDIGRFVGSTKWDDIQAVAQNSGGEGFSDPDLGRSVERFQGVVEANQEARRLIQQSTQDPLVTMYRDGKPADLTDEGYSQALSRNNINEGNIWGAREAENYQTGKGVSQDMARALNLASVRTPNERNLWEKATGKKEDTPISVEGVKEFLASRDLTIADVAGMKTLSQLAGALQKNQFDLQEVEEASQLGEEFQELVDAHTTAQIGRVVGRGAEPSAQEIKAEKDIADFIKANSKGAFEFGGGETDIEEVVETWKPPSKSEAPREEELTPIRGIALNSDGSTVENARIRSIRKGIIDRALTEASLELKTEIPTMRGTVSDLLLNAEDRERGMSAQELAIQAMKWASGSGARRMFAERPELFEEFEQKGPVQFYQDNRELISPKKK